MMRGHGHLIHILTVHRNDGAGAMVRNLALRFKFVFGLGLRTCFNWGDDFFHAGFGGSRLRFFAERIFAAFRLFRLQRILQRHGIISND